MMKDMAGCNYRKEIGSYLPLKHRAVFEDNAGLYIIWMKNRYRPILHSEHDKTNLLYGDIVTVVPELKLMTQEIRELQVHGAVVLSKFLRRVPHKGAIYYDPIDAPEERWSLDASTPDYNYFARVHGWSNTTVSSSSVHTPKQKRSERQIINNALSRIDEELKKADEALRMLSSWGIIDSQSRHILNNITYTLSWVKELLEVEK